MRSERSKWRLKWVFLFISHETSEFPNSTLFFLLSFSSSLECKKWVFTLRSEENVGTERDLLKGFGFWFWGSGEREREKEENRREEKRDFFLGILEMCVLLK
jgi:hypothetical protein